MTFSTAPVPEKSLKEWHAPSTRTELIHELIHGVDRYNPSNLVYMEDYLAAQVQHGEYDLLANLAILKLYQFNPQMSNPDVIINILVKSLSATVHGADFNLCLALLREPAAILSDIDSENESLAIVMPFLQQLHDLTRACRFTAFWAAYNGDSEAATILRSNPSYVPQQFDLVPSLRLLFATSIAASFSGVRLAQLSRWLDLPVDQVGIWAQAAGWAVEGDVAFIPKNGDNDVKAGVVKESVELNQLTKLVAAAAY